MNTLFIDNSDDPVSSLDQYSDGEYFVTKEIQGHKVSIKKPGLKPGYPKDIAVSIHYPNGMSKSPTHPSLISDFLNKYNADTKAGKVIFSQLEKLQNGEEPDGIDEKEEYPGLPMAILINSLKWIWIQEDRNYPQPRYLGRRMSWASYILIQHGNPDIMSEKAETILRNLGYFDDEITKIRFLSGSKHLR